MADVPWITEKTGQPTGRLLPPQTHFHHGYNDSSQKPGRGSVNTGIQSPFTCFFFFFLDLSPLPILSHMVCSPPDVLQIFVLSLVLILLISGLSAGMVYSFSGNLLNQLWMRRQHWREGKWTSSAGGKVSNRGSSLLLALQWVRLFILPTTSIYLVCTAVPRNPWVHFPWFHLPAVNHIPKILNENYQK